MGVPGRVPTPSIDFRPGPTRSGFGGVTQHSADVRLSWDKVNSTPAVWRYMWQRNFFKDYGQVDWTENGVSTGTTTDLSTIFNDVNSSRYWYHVRAQNSDGWGPWSQTVNFAAPFPPAKPTILSLNYLPPYKFRVICSTPAVTGDISGITSYYLQHSPTEDFRETFFGGREDIRDITTGNLTRLGERYFFRIRADNIAGAGRWSDPVSYLHAPGPRVMVDGEWRNTVPYVNVNGVWRLAIPYVNGLGVWRLAARSN